MKYFTKVIRNTVTESGNFSVILLLMFVLCFADSSIIPAPAQTILLLAMFMNPDKITRLFIVSVSGTVAGSLCGYLVGSILALDSSGGYSPLMKALFEHIPGLSDGIFTHFWNSSSGLNVKVLFAASFTPVPYGIFAISSGMFRVKLIEFIIVTVISQATKFYLLTLIASKPGQWIRNRIKFRLRLFSPIVLILISLLILVP